MKRASSRRHPSWLSLASGCSLALTLACGEAREPPKLALLISVDTLRADHLGFYGYPRGTSPRLDALARDAVVFDEAQSTAPWTLPSHGALLTGRYPSRLGIRSFASRLPPEIPTLAEQLQQSGWATAAFVNSRFVSARHGFDRGFDHFDYLPESYHQIGSAAELFARAARFIEGSRERPLFVFLHLYDVHSDYRARHIYKQGLVEGYQGDLAGLTPQLLAVRNGQVELQPADLDHVVNLYDAQIREMDDHLGRFLDELRDMGRFEDAFLALVADHGDEFLEHGGVLHGRSQYREVIRVPLLIRQTGWPGGRRIATPVSLIDVAPTLLSALGVPAPDGLEGRDLGPLALSQPGSLPRSWSGEERILFSEAAMDAERLGDKQAARQGRYTLHLDTASGSHRLYDLASDPGEQRDLAALNPERAAQLRAALDRFAAGARQDSPRLEISAREREELRRLGYLSAPAEASPRRVTTPIEAH